MSSKDATKTERAANATLAWLQEHPVAKLAALVWVIASTVSSSIVGPIVACRRERSDAHLAGRVDPPRVWVRFMEHAQALIFSNDDVRPIQFSSVRRTTLVLKYLPAQVWAEDLHYEGAPVQQYSEIVPGEMQTDAIGGELAAQLCERAKDPKCAPDGCGVAIDWIVSYRRSTDHAQFSDTDTAYVLDPKQCSFRPASEFTTREVRYQYLGPLSWTDARARMMNRFVVHFRKMRHPSGGLYGGFGIPYEYQRERDAEFEAFAEDDARGPTQ